MSLKEFFFSVTHISATIGAQINQVHVELGEEEPPEGWTFEDFTALPASRAVPLIRKDQSKNRGGVQLKDWSESDQKRLLRGEKPQGVPTHRDV